jgi:hypothetical protein
MSLFKAKPQTHAEIVAPLKDMAQTLTNHIKAQTENISKLDDEKKIIDEKIAFSNDEIEKSSHTVEQIQKMVNLPKDLA